MKLDASTGLLMLGIGWIGLIAWVAVKMYRAPRGVEDAKGFRTVPPKR